MQAKHVSFQQFSDLICLQKLELRESDVSPDELFTVDIIAVRLAFYSFIDNDVAI